MNFPTHCLQNFCKTLNKSAICQIISVFLQNYHWSNSSTFHTEMVTIKISFCNIHVKHQYFFLRNAKWLKALMYTEKKIETVTNVVIAFLWTIHYQRNYNSKKEFLIKFIKFHHCRSYVEEIGGRFTHLQSTLLNWGQRMFPQVQKWGDLSLYITSTIRKISIFQPSDPSRGSEALTRRPQDRRVWCWYHPPRPL